MKCEKCGTEFEGNFCPNCGTPSEAGKNICPKCRQARSGADRFCKNCGYDFHQSEKSLKTSAATAGDAAAAIKRVPKKVWITVGVVVAVIAVLLAVLIPTISHFTNKFRIGVVEQISIGDSKERVIELLGEPYDYDTDSTTFEYYSDNYLKLLEENDSFNPDDIEDWDDFENAFDDALALEEKLQTEEYSYIRVTFDSEDKVTSVLLDASRTEQTKNAAKEVSKAELLTDDVANFLQAYSDGSLAYYAQYSDGSYYMGPVQKNTQEFDEVMFCWTDSYGNRCQQYMGVNLERGWEGTQSESGEKVVYVFGDDANAPSDVTSVVILDSVTSIGLGAFSGCESLTSIEIPDSVTSIGDSAFSGCSSLTDITIPDGVTSIGRSAFENCSSLTSITIPDSVTGIGEGAFSGCNGLTSITLPFVGGSIKSATDAYQYPFGYIFGTSFYTGGTAVDQRYYRSGAGSTFSTTYYIPSSLKEVTITGGNILYGAFSGCSSLTSISIPGSVTSIGVEAFSGCSSLTSIVIPDGITSIETGTFGFCDSLTSIEIPDSVTSIGEGAFFGCDSLTSIEIPDSVTSIGDQAFECCYGLTSITIGNGVTSIAPAFRYCSNLTSITIPASVISIGGSAFYDCSRLTSVTFEDPDGWYVTQTSGATCGTDLASEDLSDPSTAAEYLANRYAYYYWYKR